MKRRSLGHGLEAAVGSCGQRCTYMLGKPDYLADSRNWPPLICQGWWRTTSWRKRRSKGRFWKCFQTLALSSSARPGRLKRVSSRWAHPKALPPSLSPWWVDSMVSHICSSLYAGKATAGSLKPAPPTSWCPLQGMVVTSVLWLPLCTCLGSPVS